MLVIQDPTDPQSTFLLESLLDAFRSAQQIAGVFSFASSRGVELFTEDVAFQEVARAYPVELIVGIDAITNIRALDALAGVSARYPNVTAKAFLNPRPEALFHPKLCWTKKQGGGHLIVGSGNLTESGLLGNWEAYSTEVLDAQSLEAVETTWNDWKARHAGSLLPLNDERVREIAAANNVLAPEGDLPTLVARPVADAAEEEPATTQVVPAGAAVLVAEIPRSGNRWKQANFHREDYVNFFGAREDVERLVIFRHVNADGSMAAYERDRPPVTVVSRNFRFELAAASGLEYPNVAAGEGRPIGVFIRVATRTFFYRLLMPNDSEYGTVSDLLQRKAGAPGNNMRTARISVRELRAEWPTAPFWNLPSTA